MQQYKGIKNISEVSKYASDSSILLESFKNIIGQFSLTAVNKLLNKAKVKGVDGDKIFKTLFVICFIGIKNVNQLMISGFSNELKYGKDVIYDYIKNEWVDWAKILLLFAKQFIKIALKKGDSTDIKSPKCLILDDTLIEKSGKTIEQIGKVFDHCTHRYILGIKALVCGFWDGKSFIPLAFSLHNEPGKTKNRGLKISEISKQFSKDREKDSPGKTRFEQISIDKITMGINMVKNALKSGIQPNYVLADSWFMCEDFITSIQQIKTKYTKILHVIGLMKTNRKITINGVQKMANLIPQHNKKNIVYCKTYKCHYITATVEYKGIKTKAFWIKFKGQDNWKMLVCTDLSLSFVNAMKYYQIRWSIEVFFKECKQNLGLNNCQSTDFDTHIAWTTLTFISYTILALRKRFDDYETMGEVFRDFKNELLEMTLIDKLWLIIHEIFTEILADLGLDLDVFVKQLIDNQDVINKLAIVNFNFLMWPNRKIA